MSSPSSRSSSPSGIGRCLARPVRSDRRRADGARGRPAAPADGARPAPAAPAAAGRSRPRARRGRSRVLSEVRTAAGHHDRAVRGLRGGDRRRAAVRPRPPPPPEVPLPVQRTCRDGGRAAAARGAGGCAGAPLLRGVRRRGGHSEVPRPPCATNAHPDAARQKGEQCCGRDEGRPLGVGVQDQAPNHLTLRWSRAGVVNGEGNGAPQVRQVRVRKTNASEPPMTCRKVSRRHRNRAWWLAREEPRRGPADGLGGVRHEGGVSLIQALLRNVGTCRPDAKGASQVSGPHKRGRTEAGHRGGVPRSSEEAGESRGSEGGTSTSADHWPTGDRRSR